MTERLDNHKRARITNAMMKHRFTKAIADMRTRHSNLASAVYEDIYAKDIEMIKSLPKGWFPEVASIRVSFGIAGTPDLFFSGGMRFGLHHSILPPSEKKCRVLSKDKDRVIKDYDSFSPLGILFEAVAEAEKILTNEVEESSNIIRSTLNSYRSMKQLAEAWPEVKPFLEAVTGSLPVSKGTLVNFSQLNARFGLPVDGKVSP